jgi:hypothetical protein
VCIFDQSASIDNLSVPLISFSGPPYSYIAKVSLCSKLSRATPERLGVLQYLQLAAYASAHYVVYLHICILILCTNTLSFMQSCGYIFLRPGGMRCGGETDDDALPDDADLHCPEEHLPSSRRKHRVEKDLSIQDDRASLSFHLSLGSITTTPQPNAELHFTSIFRIIEDLYSIVNP